MLRTRKTTHNRLLFLVIFSLLAVLLLWKQSSNDGSSLEQASPSYATFIDRIKDRNELRVGTLHSLTPYYIDHNADTSTPSGFDYELSRLFADYLGVQIKIVQRNNLSDLFDALENNEIDLIADGLVYLPERKIKFRTSPSYYSVSQQLVYQQGTSKPQSVDGLKGELEVAANSAQSVLLSNLKNKQKLDVSWRESDYLTQEDLVKQVAMGELDYTIADSVTIAILQRIYPRLAVAFDLSEEQPVNWYLNRSKDESLYKLVLQFFKLASEDGSIARLEEKYLGHMGEFDFVDTRSFLFAIEKRLPLYRKLFEKYGKARDIDWQMLAAIAYQESHWNADATSSTGVRGLMMLTQNTAKSLGVTDRLDPEQSIRGGATYLDQLIQRLPKGIQEEDKIWFALTAYNMGFAHMLDARALTRLQGDNPDSWLDVKKRLPMLSQEEYYSQTKYGYARGYQAYDFVESIRRYRVSLAGYLFEKEVQAEDLARRKELMEQQHQYDQDGQDSQDAGTEPKSINVNQVAVKDNHTQRVNAPIQQAKL